MTTKLKSFKQLTIEQITQAQHDWPETKADPYRYTYEVDGFGFVVKCYGTEPVAIPTWMWEVG